MWVAPPADRCKTGRGVPLLARMPRLSGQGKVLPSERRRMIAERLVQRGSVSVAALEQEFGISPMTARRDLDELERQGIARRTHGGAILPGASAHEDSFVQRLEVAAEDKERLADRTWNSGSRRRT